MYKSSINIYLFVQSLAVTDKQESVSLNIISVDLSAFSDFVNVFIRYRSKKKHIPTIIDGHRDGFHHGFFSYHKIIPTE